MKKIFFLLNSIREFDFLELIDKYLTDVKISCGEVLPVHTEEYDLVILWGYRKIIPDIGEKKNIILFHSSDLPKGKGWAPIYNAIVTNAEYHVISGIFALDEVDSGDIIVQAKFKIRDSYTAEHIRRWDTEISIMMIKEILTKFEGREIRGIKQIGEESFYPKRTRNDNEVFLHDKLGDIVGHLRACERSHPAFFNYRNEKFKIFVEPWAFLPFPDDVQVLFYDEHSSQ